MSSGESTRRLARSVSAETDHILGEPDATLTLVEYGSYACHHCRDADEEIARLRARFGSRLRYVFRHRPLEHNELARASANLAECVDGPENFWVAHTSLMNRSAELTDDDLRSVSSDLGLDALPDDELDARRRKASQHVDADISGSLASGVSFTPTFFVNGTRYDGPWDHHSLAEALLGSIGHRVRAAATGFGSWAPSAAILLGLVTALALILANLPVGSDLQHFWDTPLAMNIGEVGLSLSFRQWINDGLLSLFFLAVGLEMKREFTVGLLATRRLAALPVSAALGGMLVPAVLYLVIAGSTGWQRGAGIPMPTDTAFAVALIAMLGSRVPIALRVFLTAASIVDDIGTIIVVAIFYSSTIHFAAIAVGALLILILLGLNRSGIYRAWPYAVVGILLWIALHDAGVHATLAGVLLAILIPTRPPANLGALLAQAEAVIRSEPERNPTASAHGQSLPMLNALDAIHDRIESPADRVLRTIAPWSTYVVLPLFALANAGLVVNSGIFAERELLALAISVGLVIGKPTGFLLASALAIRLGWTDRPQGFTLTQIVGAGALAGIGFTMSLFIAGQAFSNPLDVEAAKASILGASMISATVGCVILIRARSPTRTH